MKKEDKNILRLIRICGLTLICTSILIFVIFYRKIYNPGLLCVCAIACTGLLASGLILLFSAKMYARQQKLALTQNIQTKAMQIPTEHIVQAKE